MIYLLLCVTVVKPTPAVQPHQQQLPTLRKTVSLQRYAVTVINCSISILEETFRWLSSVISCCPARVLYFEQLGSVRERLVLCGTYCNRCNFIAVCKHSGVSWTTEVGAECGTPLTFILAANCELVCDV